MYASFALALLAATTFAIGDSPVRGDNNGTSQEDALYTSFINNDTCGNGKYVKVDMWTYIQWNPDENNYEYHGDTVAYIEGPVGKFLQYGFCIHIATSEAGEKTWDCQQIDVSVILTVEPAIFFQNIWGQFTLTDWQYTGTRDDFTWANVKASGSTSLVRDKVSYSGVLNESTKTTADYNWQIDSDKSFTNCGFVSSDGMWSSDWIYCPRPAADASLEDRMKGGINLHWFR